MTLEYLRGCFETVAGPVSDVSLVRKVEAKQIIPVAFVTFELPEDAAKWVYPDIFLTVS